MFIEKTKAILRQNAFKKTIGNRSNSFRLPIAFLGRSMLFTILLVCAFSSAVAQTTRQEAYWVRVYLRKTLPQHQVLHWEIDERRLVQPDRQLQFISHLHLHRLWGKKAEGSLGITYSVANQLSEWRPFQEFFYRMPLHPAITWSNRFRTEQRYLQRSDDTWHWRFRFRYRFQLDYRPAPRWNVKAGDEIMYHADGFDQNRIYCALEHRFSKYLSTELGYLKIYQARTKTVFFDRDVARFTIYFDFF